MKHSHGHHHPGGRGHRGERGERGGRFFESGDLRYLILHLIGETPRHGYDVIKAIEEQTGGSHAPSPGVVYPTLTMLEEMGWAALTLDGSRKLYTITDDGRQALDENRPMVEAILQRMRHAAERHAHHRGGPMARALENLKLVLRMHGDRWTPDQTYAAIDIIDDAARRIERLLPPGSVDAP